MFFGVSVNTYTIKKADIWREGEQNNQSGNDIARNG